MKIAVHQMSSGINPAQNAQIMNDAIYQAASEGALMYFAPEMSILLDRDRNRAAASIVAEIANPALSGLLMTAKDTGMWIHLGSLPVLDEAEGKYANRSIVIKPDGEICCRYDKMHLFDVDLSSGESWRESAAYKAGTEPVAVETPLGLMGLTICYDLRFSQLYGAYGEVGVDILAVPAAFTVPTGKAHWHTLLRARAIETQAFVVAAAQCGLHEDGRQTYGHSLVIDPWGEILLDMKDASGLGFVTIDRSRLSEVRRQIPAQLNRRDIDMPVRIC